MRGVVGSMSTSTITDSAPTIVANTPATQVTTVR
jgi:hypothetical protein